jgi:hypothetical protein
MVVLVAKRPTFLNFDDTTLSRTTFIREIILFSETLESCGKRIWPVLQTMAIVVQPKLFNFLILETSISSALGRLLVLDIKSGTGTESKTTSGKSSQFFPSKNLLAEVTLCLFF